MSSNTTTTAEKTKTQIKNKQIELVITLTELNCLLTDWVTDNFDKRFLQILKYYYDVVFVVVGIWKYI